jgi:hypothetical protein
MASVRMTHELRSIIEREGKQMYNVANPKPVLDETIKNQIRKAIQDSEKYKATKKFYEESIDIAQVSAGRNTTHAGNDKDLLAVSEISEIDLYVPNIDGTKDSHTLRLTLPLKLQYYSAQIYNSWETARISTRSFQDAQQLKITQAVSKYKMLMSEYEKKKVEYGQNLYSLVWGVTTLKQFLEVWPAGESLVPKDKLAAMHVKITRATRAQQIKEDINFDPSVGNQTILTAKMLGG